MASSNVEIRELTEVPEGPPRRRPRRTGVVAVAGIAAVAALATGAVFLASGGDGPPPTIEVVADDPDSSALVEPPLVLLEPSVVRLGADAGGTEVVGAADGTVWLRSLDGLTVLVDGSGESVEVPVVSGRLGDTAAVDPDGSRVWVSGRIDGREALVGVDATGETTTIPLRFVSSGDVRFLDDRHVFVDGGGGYAVVDVASGEVLHEATHPRAAVVDGGGTVVFALNDVAVTDSAVWLFRDRRLFRVDHGSDDVELVSDVAGDGVWSLPHAMVGQGDHLVRVVARSSGPVDTFSMTPTVEVYRGAELVASEELPTTSTCSVLRGVDDVVVTCDAAEEADRALELWRVDLEAGEISLQGKVVVPDGLQAMSTSERQVLADGTHRIPLDAAGGGPGPGLLVVGEDGGLEVRRIEMPSSAVDLAGLRSQPGGWFLRDGDQVLVWEVGS